MSVETITSVKNPLGASLRALKTAKARRETGLFLVEGETMLNEALSSGLVPRALLTEAETPLAALRESARRARGRLRHQDPAGHVRRL